jgi:hypothetical protein
MILASYEDEKKDCCLRLKVKLISVEEGFLEKAERSTHQPSTQGSHFVDFLFICLGTMHQLFGEMIESCVSDKQILPTFERKKRGMKKK